MKIAIIGYGKMGKEIEQIAISRGHSVVLKIDSKNADFSPNLLKDVNCAIEFSVPESAINNIKKCFSVGVPIVVGTTGWYDNFETIKKLCLSENNTLFYATNFSIGVNIFFELNKKLSALMNKTEGYELSMNEIHHIHKLDAPSGTAKTLAEGIIETSNKYNKWTETSPKKNEFLITHQRIGETIGTHQVKYESDIDHIFIEHKAKNRKGFALGAVLAAEFITNKKGVFSMKDLLEL